MQKSKTPEVNSQEIWSSSYNIHEWALYSQRDCRREFSWTHFEAQYNPQEDTKQHGIYLAMPSYYKKAKAVIKHAGQRMEAER